MFRFNPSHLLALVLLPLTAVAAPAPPEPPRVLLVVSSEGRDQGKSRPGFEMDEFAQAWLILKRNGFAIDVASPRGGAVEADKYNPQEPFNAALLAARVLAVYDDELADRLDEWVERQTASVAEYPVDEAP